MANNDLVSRVYSGFRGVDFRGEEINLVRSPDSLNMWKDYKRTESIRTRPEMELDVAFDETIYGIFFFNDEKLVHSGTKLYSVYKGEKTELYTDLREAPSDSFIFYDEEKGKPCWYFKDGKHYLCYYGRDDSTKIGKVVGYVPTTSIARRPAGGGTDYEYVNFLSPRRINTFLADGIATEYYLDYFNIDTDFFPVVKILNGKGEWQEVKDCYDVDSEQGKIIFNGSFTLDGFDDVYTCPPMPLTAGQDTVSIEYSKTNKEYEDTILKCTLLQVFDNRVFFSGNPDYPNRIYNCNLNDPTYCDDRDHYQEGTDDAMVKGMVAGNNALWVFREPSQANTTVFYHTPAIDNDAKIYPNTHSSVSTGCIGKAINFNDDIVFFSERGMEGISGDITTEQVLGHRSTLVDRKMIAEDGYKGMVLAEWEGYLFVFIGNKAYLADSRATFQNENHFEYEWFYWEMPHNVTCARVEQGKLYLGTEKDEETGKSGIYTLTDTEKAVESYWVTPKDKFQNPHRLKTTNKRGCVVEAEGDITVFTKLEDTGFVKVDTYEGVTDYFVSRIKRKKFKDIQLKFYSPTRFALETATLECFVGGYIKR